MTKDHEIVTVDLKYIWPRWDFVKELYVGLQMHKYNKQNHQPSNLEKGR